MRNVIFFGVAEERQIELTGRESAVSETLENIYLDYWSQIGFICTQYETKA